MEGFDDKEQEKQSKRLSEKLKLLHLKMKEFTPEKKQKCLEAFEVLKEQVEILNEKKKLGTITAVEKAIMADLAKRLKPIRQGLEDAKLLLDNSLLTKSVAFYNAVKQKAESGDKAAQQVYDRLRPLYQQMLKSNLSKNLN